MSFSYSQVVSLPTQRVQHTAPCARGNCRGYTKDIDEKANKAFDCLECSYLRRTSESDNRGESFPQFNGPGLRSRYEQCQSAPTGKGHWRCQIEEHHNRRANVKTPERTQTRTRGLQVTGLNIFSMGFNGLTTERRGKPAHIVSGPSFPKSSSVQSCSLA